MKIGQGYKDKEYGYEKMDKKGSKTVFHSWLLVKGYSISSKSIYSPTFLVERLVVVLVFFSMIISPICDSSLRAAPSTSPNFSLKCSSVFLAAYLNIFGANHFANILSK